MKSSHAHPPESLDRPLEQDPSEWSFQDNYHLMTGLVIPRPIAWMSSLSADGVRNIAPHSFFNAVATDPPHVMVSSTGVKDSVRNIRATKEFVLNIVTMDVLDDMVFTSTDFPPEEDEFDWSGLTPVPSAKVAPPRIAEAKAHLECVLAPEAWEAARLCRTTGKAARLFRDFAYQTETSWSRPRRVVGKAEHLPDVPTW